MDESSHIFPAAVIGTAGHIDHGKSAIVRALSGIDPDRLPEEKKRGITIQLGYAFLDLPSGRRVSIVDVPGHERFVKTMAQGASVIQIGLFVVDAGEGVKPQTVEHLHILRSMGVRKGVIALTKCDAAPEDIQELAEEEVRELAAGTFLGSATVVRTSAVTGQGLDELKEEMDRLTLQVGGELERMPMRVPVDRIFSVAGFGTVVTGTLVGGKVKEGDEVLIQPGGKKVKVRGMQVHDVGMKEARAPCRIALNLTGIEADRGVRGRWVSYPGFFLETTNILARIEGMPWLKREIKVPARLSLNMGSGVFPCRLFAGGAVRAGENILARIAIDQPVIARTMDRFVLRLPGGVAGGYSTVAGGVVVDPRLREKKITRRHLETYGSPAGMSDEDFISAAVTLAGRRGVSKQEVLLKAPGHPAELEKVMGRLSGSGKIMRTRDKVYFDSGVFEEVGKSAAHVVDDFHKKRPELEGMKRDALKKLIRPSIPARLFDLLVESFVKKSLWRISGDLISRAGFKPKSDEVTGKLSGNIMRLVERAPSTPPSIKEVPGLTGENKQDVQRAVQFLVTSGKIKVLDGEFLYSVDFLRKFSDGIEKFFTSSGELRITELKEIAGVSRKYALPLARWLDDEGITLRRGEIRMKKKSL